jgi:gliding motility-associated-like protein
MNKLLLSLLCLTTTAALSAQNIGGTINSNAIINAIDYCNSVVSVNTSFMFNVGDRVLVIQMKGGAINTFDAPAFGQVTDYGKAGLYEFSTIQAKTGNQLTLSNALLNEYSIEPGLMLVRVPVYNNNVTVTSTLTCNPWNGSTGGVLALEVNGTLTLNADIDASGRGFRLNASVTKDTCCATYGYVYPVSSGNAGSKGESFVVMPASVNAGRGPAAHGGGGGNMHNAGGGGGAHGGGGGSGGLATFFVGYNNLNTGGIGGLALDYSTDQRWFMGGGAGNGHDNNYQNYTQGGRGGGIIYVKANEVVFNGFAIRANGADGPNDATQYSDGLPGGGGGGLVYLQINTFTGTATVEARGGKGGSNLLDPALQVSDAAGGGGGGGVVMLSGATPANWAGNVSGGAKGDHSLLTGMLNQAAAGQNGLVLSNRAIQQSTAPNAVIPPLMPQVSVAQVCEGGTTTLSALDITNATYTWTGPVGFIASGSTTIINSITPAQAGTYSVVANLIGCVSPPYTVQIGVTPTVNTTQSAEICDNQTYTLPNAAVVNTGGSYPVTLIAATGCDSVVTTQLTVWPTYNTPFSDYFCEGTSYLLPGGEAVSTPGNYPILYSTQHGCDSTVVYTITQSPTNYTTVNAGICAGNTYTLPDGTTVASQGAYAVTLTNAWGCDSIVTTQLTVWPLQFTNTQAAICQGESHILPNGVVVTAAGSYTSVLLDQHGCDSTITTQLTVWALTTTTRQDTICNGGIHVLPDGQTTNTAGTYTSILTDQNGCDSTVVTQLAVIPFFETPLTATICSNESYTMPDGSQGTLSGVYNYTLTAQNGCDSLVTLNLTVLPIAQSVTIDTICAYENYQWQGSILTTSGTYIDTLIAHNGCDSIATLNLHVQPLDAWIEGPTIAQLGDDVLLTAVVTPPTTPVATLIWTAQTIEQCPTCYSFTFQAIDPVLTTLVVTTPQGCTATDTLFVNVNVEDLRVFVPNAFTPNSDGTNDKFRPWGGPEVLDFRDFQVFDRWGNQVFSQQVVLPNDPDAGWDGTFRGLPGTSDLYVYVFNCRFINSTNKFYSGDVLLVR